MSRSEIVDKGSYKELKTSVQSHLHEGDLYWEIR